jgi:hypothetical protein
LPSTWRNREIDRRDARRSRRLSERSWNPATRKCGFAVFRPTPDAGWSNIATAEPTRGPSSRVVLRKDRGSKWNSVHGHTNGSPVLGAATAAIKPDGRGVSWRSRLCCLEPIGSLLGQSVLLALADSHPGCPATMGCRERQTTNDCSVWSAFMQPASTRAVCDGGR